jgi:hypothetical protein
MVSQVYRNNIPQVKRRDQTHQCHSKRKNIGDKFLTTKWVFSAKAKLIVAKQKPELIQPFAFFM